MKKTYELSVNAYDSTKAEAAVNLMDKIVRRWYNVYGGYRAYSGKGAGGEYYIYVEYTADWDSTALHLLPDWDDIKKAFIHLLWRIDPANEVEVHTRPMPWKN